MTPPRAFEVLLRQGGRVASCVGEFRPLKEPSLFVTRLSVVGSLRFGLVAITAQFNIKKNFTAASIVNTNHTCIG